MKLQLARLLIKLWTLHTYYQESSYTHLMSTLDSTFLSSMPVTKFSHLFFNTVVLLLQHFYTSSFFTVTVLHPDESSSSPHKDRSDQR